MPGMTWTADNELQLLLFLMGDAPLSNEQVAAAARMFTQGDTVCTQTAIRRKVQKLREKGKRLQNNMGAAQNQSQKSVDMQSASSSKVSPKKRKISENEEASDVEDFI